MSLHHDWLRSAKQGSDRQRLFKLVSLDEVRVVKDSTGKREDGAIQIVISTSDVDRDRDTVNQAGWELGPFLKNPVVLFAHDYYSPPVARAPRTYPDAGRLVSIPEFTPPDLYPFGDMVGRMLSRGFLNAASVGFTPLEWTFDEERGGANFLRQELNEYSICPVPSNPNALVAAKAEGIDIAPLTTWVEKALDASLEAGLSLPRELLERAYGVTTGGRVSIVVQEKTAMFKGVVPGNVSEKKAAKDAAWSAPALKDFTDKAWGDLSDKDKKHIAGHYAWAKESPAASFGDLKLPHHDAKTGAVVFRGVVAAAGRLDQTDLPAGDKDKVKAHLAAHYHQFDEKAPWEDKAAGSPVEKDPGQGIAQGIDGNAVPEDETEIERPEDGQDLAHLYAPVKALATAIKGHQEAVKALYTSFGDLVSHKEKEDALHAQHTKALQIHKDTADQVTMCMKDLLGAVGDKQNPDLSDIPTSDHAPIAPPFDQSGGGKPTGEVADTGRAPVLGLDTGVDISAALAGGTLKADDLVIIDDDPTAKDVKLKADLRELVSAELRILSGRLD